MKLERSSGILAHPTSFPGPYGIGDLGDGSKAFIDFLNSAKQTLWQILPLGPTSFGDSPYQSFSTFAGNPMLISPDLLLSEKYVKAEDLKSIPAFDPLKIEYGKVITYKNKLFKLANKNFIQQGTKAQKASFADFCKKNAEWLDDYSLFVSLKTYFIEERKNTFESKEYMAFAKLNQKQLTENAIKDYYYGAVWTSWPEELVKRDKKEIEKWKIKLKDEIQYNNFLQFEFFRQWEAIKKYANSSKIKIIGDIPIFVAYDSSDVWANPDLFFLDEKGYPTVVAGVPPDYFSETGQLWGNPTYNWQKHNQTDFSWWITRIKRTLDTVDLLRIDHFRGFESNWAVSFGDKTAVNGKWCKGPGILLFNAIEKALGKLPIIAEDLGIITEEVNELRESCGFPGMKVLQFAFDSDEENAYYPHNYKDSNCIVYTGTHDNDTTVGWYNKSDEKDRDSFRRYLNVAGDHASWDLIRLALSSIAAYAIMPIQDVMILDSDARMNTPGIAGGNWMFRYTSDMLEEHMAEGLKYLSTLFNRYYFK